MANLTADRIRILKEPGRYGDGNGLFLVITKAKTKQWVQRIHVDGKRADKGLGGYPKVTLASARKLAVANKAAVSTGHNPWTEPKPTPAPAPILTMPTLRQACYAVHENKAGKWSAAYARKWLERLNGHIIPKLGDRDIDSIARRELAAILAPICRTMPETARKLRQSLQLIFRWAVANDYRADNPADDALPMLLPDVDKVVKHRAALHYSEVPAAVQAIINSESWGSTKLCFQWLILTGARSWESRGATWNEIKGDVWEIPATRMKMSRSHKVGLSEQAKAILREARELYRERKDDSDWPTVVPPNGYIFPHPSLDTHLSENCLSLRAKKSDMGAVPHGFRSSFRDWAQEQSGASWAAIELSLAHKVGTSVEAAYFRSDLLAERGPLMQAWADYVLPMPNESPF